MIHLDALAGLATMGLAITRSKRRSLVDLLQHFLAHLLADLQGLELALHLRHVRQVRVAVSGRPPRMQLHQLGLRLSEQLMQAAQILFNCAA